MGKGTQMAAISVEFMSDQLEEMILGSGIQKREEGK